MSEIISLSFGPAGNLIGDSQWELLSADHSVNDFGVKEKFNEKYKGFSSFFEEKKSGSYTPRAIFAGPECGERRIITKGIRKNLYDPQNVILTSRTSKVISVKSDVNKEHEIIIERLRKLIENCDSPEGFLLHYELACGSGFSLGKKMLEYLGAEFGKKHKIVVAVFPSKNNLDSPHAPYNYIQFGADDNKDNKMNIMIQKEALYNLHVDRERSKYPYDVVGQVISSLTAPWRFCGSSVFDMADLYKYLVPYPDYNLITPAFVPNFLSHKIETKETNLTARELNDVMYETKPHLFDCSFDKNLFISCMMMYRGNLTYKRDELVNSKLHQNVKFSEDLSTGFHIDLTKHEEDFNLRSRQDEEFKNSLCLLSNSTAAVQTLKLMSYNLIEMYRRYAFLSHFTDEGMEKDYIDLCDSNIEKMLSNYKALLPEPPKKKQENKD